MRSLSFLLAIASVLAVTAGFWSKEDHEIFRLRDELEIHEGSGVTFYDFLGVKPSASQDEINRAYRARSRTLHPDKAKHRILSSRFPAPTAAPANHDDDDGGAAAAPPPPRKPSNREIRAATKEASERFARLGLIAAILRGAERARYDHFLANGFPRWRGTGYYYARFRPGLLTTLLGLFAFAGGALHYVALVLGWRRRRGFAQRLVAHARTEAWGGSAAGRGVPGLDHLGDGGAEAEDAAAKAPPAMNRRERRLQAREDEKERRTKRNRSRSASGVGARKDLPPSAPGEPAPEGAVKRVTALNGKPLIVDSNGRVFLVEGEGGGSSDDEDEDEEDVVVQPMLYLLSPEAIEKPRWKDTLLWQLPLWTVRKLTERVAATHQKAKPTETHSEAEGDAGNFVLVEKADGQASGDGLGAQETATGKQGGGKQRKRKGKGR